MRRALGLAGGGPGPAGLAHPKRQLPKSGNRSPDRPSGVRPGPRFVQDGDVLVTMVGRPRQHDADGPGAPSLSHLGVAEAALATERAARETAERSLQEARATIHDLQTQQGHTELARREASEAVRAAQDGLEALPAEFQQREARLHEDLAAERRARAAAERTARVVAEVTLHESAVSRAPAEQERPATLVSKHARGSQAALLKRTAKASAAGLAKTMRKASAAPKQREPQPVKWWLKTANKR